MHFPIHNKPREVVLWMKPLILRVKYNRTCQTVLNTCIFLYLFVDKSLGAFIFPEKINKKKGVIRQNTKNVNY